MAEYSRRQEALDYHERPKPGKLGISVTKPFSTYGELSLAYTPGVAEPVKAIRDNPSDAYRYTSKGNLVAVISNGTAVLGLGNTGALASKPVMEGKAVLFKKFADIDVFDIEVDADTVEAMIETVTRIAPTFGGINLEDIAAPACFEIENALVERLDIPVFHDDQHGTAIIVAAGLINALELQDKQIADAKIVCMGAGAAAIASMDLLIEMGVTRENIYMCDSRGVIHDERDDLSKYKAKFATRTDKRTVDDAMAVADVFVGLSGPDTVSKEQIASMPARPVVFALSNPNPEITPEDAKRVRDDLIMATGRSDYPNQINNVLGFPYIFRGALDVRAARINMPMCVAAARAMSELARRPVPRTVLEAHDRDEMSFGPDYIIPSPFDPRLIDFVPPAIAAAAIETGVARTDYPSHYPQPAIDIDDQ
ncbi:malic enzyme-like NAD(P)-binding protein [Salinisphaera sp. Q1T1-3]|uniref:malic enzyme-like NAD(P)-binding protein n=1 Tax=Salinisphaera sp. Q1T1-3 TaxID=2321229 RepID=UPI000E76DB9E|nr:malic enzyme-like NAD(P)-binding protein [Salinisphaera sp. Q1T1-3]RJS94316.1 malate dehydrogenase [Salinisphaera sp. Q1T1-3]